MTLSFESLPAEIYSCIIAQLDVNTAHQTILALTRAIPYSAVPQYELFRTIRIRRPGQVEELLERIKRDIIEINQWYKSPSEKEEAHYTTLSSYIQSFSLETFNANASLVLDLLSLLPNLRELEIWIGSRKGTTRREFGTRNWEKEKQLDLEMKITNLDEQKSFEPEDLEELFSIDKPGRHLICVQNSSLHSLSLRFRPYVQIATYHQFLSGSYFGPILDAVTRWPAPKCTSGGITMLSIVQDPYVNLAFAQPLIFFHLESTLPALLRSPFFQSSLRGLRLCLPVRTLASLSRILTLGRTSVNLTTVDLSTAIVSASSTKTMEYLAQILTAHPFLSHLILNECGPNGLLPVLPTHGDVFGIEADVVSAEYATIPNSILAYAPEYRTLALGLATAGVSKARNREKQVQAQTLAGTGTIGESNIRIIPPTPTLRSLCTSLNIPIPIPQRPPSSHTLNAHHALLLKTINDQWTLGWSQGLAQLGKARERIRDRWRVAAKHARARNGAHKDDGNGSGMRVMRFATLSETEEDLSSLDSGPNPNPLESLVEIVDEAELSQWISSNSAQPALQTPVLCLAGQSDSLNRNDFFCIPHSPGCAHEVARK